MNRNKKFIFNAVMLSVALLPFAGKAEQNSVLENVYIKTASNPYISDNSHKAEISASIINANPDNHQNESVRIGYRPLAEKGLLSNARFEEELSRSVSTNDYKSLGSTRIMSNLLYDFQNTASFSSYIGVGAGLLHLESNEVLGLDSKSEDTSDIVPAYQVMTGLSYKPENMPSVQLHLGYSYSATVGTASPVDHELYNRQEYEINGHSMAAGLKFNF